LSDRLVAGVVLAMRGLTGNPLLRIDIRSASAPSIVVQKSRPSIGAAGAP
jgi:hypothetical protein